MRACWYERTGPAKEVLELGEMVTPEPGPGEVRVRVTVSAVNPSDTKARGGWRGRPISFPRVVPHQDGAGVIDKVGPGASSSRVGERVWISMAQRGRPFGTAAEFTVVPDGRAVHLPDHVSFEEGACLGIPAMTAHRAVYADGDVSGKAVLVQGGAGAVGFYALQFARLGGASSVIATVSREEQAVKAKLAGADHVVNYRQEPVTGRIESLLGKRASVDRIVEVAFGKNVDADVEMLRTNGVIAAYASDEAIEPKIPFTSMLLKDLTVRFVYVYEMPEAARTQALRDIGRLLRAGQLKHQVAEIFAFEQIALAHERMEEGRAVGKLLLRVA